MGGIKNIFKGEHGNFFKYAAVITTFFLLRIMFNPGANVILWVRSAIEISRQEKQMEEYRKEIDRMEHRIKMLTSDRDTLEKFARETFYFAEPGDDVYIIEED